MTTLITSAAGWLIKVIGTRVVESITDRALQRVGLLKITCQRCSASPGPLEVRERTPTTLTCGHCGHQGTILIEDVKTLNIQQVQFANIQVREAQIYVGSAVNTPKVPATSSRDLTARSAPHLGTDERPSKIPGIIWVILMGFAVVFLVSREELRRNQEVRPMYSAPRISNDVITEVATTVEETNFSSGQDSIDEVQQTSELQQTAGAEDSEIKDIGSLGKTPAGLPSPPMVSASATYHPFRRYLREILENTDRPSAERQASNAKPGIDANNAMTPPALVDWKKELEFRSREFRWRKFWTTVLCEFHMSNTDIEYGEGCNKENSHFKYTWGQLEYLCKTMKGGVPAVVVKPRFAGRHTLVVRPEAEYAIDSILSRISRAKAAGVEVFRDVSVWDSCDY